MKPTIQTIKNIVFTILFFIALIVVAYESAASIHERPATEYGGQP